MARPIRLQYAGALYHVTDRGDRKEAVFTCDADRISFLQLLNTTSAAYRWHILAYCLMDNHYHLVLQTTMPSLAAGMKRLNGVYTQRLNRVYGRVGHVFQGRYKSQTIGTEQHLFEACRYVVLNPVRAGLVNDPADWSWSSYRASAELDAPLSCLDAGWVRERVTESGGAAGYIEWIRQGTSDACDFLHPERARTAGAEQPTREPPLSQEDTPQPLLDLLAGCTWTRGGSDDLRVRIRKAMDAGYSQRAIAKILGVSHVAVSRFTSGVKR